MLAGLGASPLTPPLGTELAGYGYYLGRRATAVRDPLFARALALEADGRRHVIVCCDVLGLNKTVVEAVREALEARWRCPPEHTLIVSVHTHSGPAIKYHEGCGETDPRYVATVAPAIAAACAEAFETMSPVSKLEVRKAPMRPLLAYNRAAEDGPVDPQVRALWIGRRGAADIALVSMGCHAVTRGRTSEISADYPGQVCRLLAEKGVQAMFLNGLCGDIDPVHPHEGDLAERFAGAVADACLGAAGAPLPRVLRGGRETFTLRLLRVTEAEIRAAADHAAANAAIPGGDAVARVWEKEMLAKYGELEATEPFDVSWLSLGGTPVVALPFEGFTHTGALLRAAVGTDDALVLGCAEEILGYLPTRGDIVRGAYAALESTFLYKRLPALAGEAERLGAEIGKRLAEAGAGGLS